MLDTGGIRGMDGGFPLALFWNEHLLPESSIERRAGRIAFEISPGMFRANGAERLTIVTAPLDVRGTGERRRLGLPLRSVRFEARDGV